MKGFYIFLILGIATPMALCVNVHRAARSALVADSVRSDTLFGKAKSMSRIKRQNDISPDAVLGPRDPQMCALDCMEVLGDKLKDAFPALANGTDEDLSSTMMAKYNDEEFDKFCEIYTPSSRCLDLCQDTKLKKILENSLATADYICIDHYADFKKYGECINNASYEVDNLCQNQCGQLENMTEIMANFSTEMHQRSNKSNDDGDDDDDLSEETVVNEVTDMLNRSCTYVNCLIDCDKPVVEQRCGPEAAELEKGVLRIALSSTYDLLKTTGADFTWPQICDRVEDRMDKDSDDDNTGDDGNGYTSGRGQSGVGTITGTTPGFGQNTRIVIPSNQVGD